MNRRGFALLAVLWLITALAVLAGGGLALVRTGLKASGNRVILARAAWAREACVELMMARGFASARGSPRLQVARTEGRVDLGRTTWCSLEVDDPSSRLNLNLADEVTLKRLVGDSLADALLDWRDADDTPSSLGVESEWYRRERRFLPRNGPLASIEELRLIRGFDSLAVQPIADLVTVRGRGMLNVNTAPPEVLNAVLNLPGGVIQLVLDHRMGGAPLGSLDQLLSMVPPSYSVPLMSQYAELTQQLAFAPGELIVVATGGVGNSPLQARATLTVVPMPDRVAVIRRETE